ncbi:uncharacterized protein SPSK_08717 [Sporothrix schenckii 1099-18]|uniref:Restriction of telomere capping protein 4 n=2 Tax=Sporothrix schenckii TaxID=29908 RepID=U7PYM6_SPOS1|nr:uncharacterized protein SPSK_08717 [Sporothrix schenckii 1099-18]ERS99834.1 hypothetical protein HMPREF1624_03199 [Sporothrix schenckii ATCC 58251]KJR85781.1 hypothetical protein SPSK_08717 [Sporothrix schenckii 1099-18]
MAPRWQPPRRGVIAPPSRGLTAALRARKAMEAAAAAAPKRPVRVAASVDAPPLSSSDDEDADEDKDEDQETDGNMGLSDDISDSSSPENDRSRGSIRRTAFKRPGGAATRADSSRDAGSRRRSHLLVAGEMRKSNVGGSSGSNNGSGCDGGQRGTKRPRPDEEAAPTTANGKGGDSSHSNGVVRSRPAPRATYGGRKRPGLATARSVSSTSAKAKVSFKRHEDSVSDISEPDETAEKARAPKARFIKPPELSPEKPKTPAKFKHSTWARSDDDSEDEKEAKGNKKGTVSALIAKPTFKLPANDGEDDLDEDGQDKDVDQSKSQKSKAFTSASTKTTTKPKPKPKSRATTDPDPDPDPDKPMSKAELMRSRQKWRLSMNNKKQAKEDKASQLFGQLDVEGGSDNEARDTSPSSSSQPQPQARAVFKMPAFSESFPVGEDDGAGDSDRPLSDVLAGVEDADNDVVSIADSDDTMAYKGPAVCPLCKAPLDEDMLRALLPDHALLAGVSFARIAQTRSAIPLNLLKFDEKLRFCTGHKQRASRLAWTARGYPTIDWDALPTRLVRHEKHIHRVLLGKAASPYRASWETTDNVSLRTAVVPGYYGRRGLRVLSDAIVQRHAPTLRKRVVEDPLVAARGMAQYVQAVLVPELAVQLIREDMQQGGAGASSADEARRVLEESAAIGEDVMDEERDVVDDDDDDDEDDENEEGKRANNVYGIETEATGYDYIST